ncbi:MAG: AMP-binding protein, partial [Acidobacteriota bacterium]
MIRTLNQALTRAARHANAGVRLLDRRERETWVSWSRIHEQAGIVAAGLAASGVERGAAVGLLYPTSEEFFSAFFGTLLSGAVPVPLYPPTRFGRLESYRLRTAGMLAAAKARLALVDRRALPLIEEALGQASCTGICLGDLPNNGSVCEEVTEDELALVQFSSGTTVDPKPVALTHRAVLA